MIYHENLRKVGILIRFHRRKKRKMRAIGFTQEDFILTTRKHSFFEVDTGQPVCSRKTLCQLENGKDIQEESLYRFFLSKLDLEYTYSPHYERMFSLWFIQFDRILCSGKIEELVELNPIAHRQRNVVHDFYEMLLTYSQRFYVEAELPPKDILEEIIELWTIVPIRLKPHLRIILLVSHILRRDICRREIRTVLDFTSKHPVDLWIDAVYAVSTGRINFCENLLRRIRTQYFSSQWLTYLTYQLRSFVIVSQQGRRLEDVASIPPTLPIFKLGRRILLSRLGNDAVKRQDFKRAYEYLSPISDPPDMLGIHASLFLRKPLDAFKMKDMSRRNAIVARYLSMDIDRQAHDKLEFLMSVFLPMVDPEDRYLITCLFRDLHYLVAHTRKYKCLHECAYILQLTQAPVNNVIAP